MKRLPLSYRSRRFGRLRWWANGVHWYARQWWFNREWL